ncbi:MAG: DUF4384 domain-containing protein [Pyrinomonadaceae bacterium]|nr:DUF4384 domain-containing protein [Pyrinomonadaceae bacterium]
MSSHRPERKRIDHGIVLCPLIVFFSLVILLGIQSATLANPPQGTRKIVSDDFTKNRQEAAPTTSNIKGAPGQSSGVRRKQRPRGRTYLLASSPVTGTRPKTKVGTVAQVGITIWRLRPVTSNDSGARMLVREKDKSSEWAAERVGAGTTFRQGDHVRLSIESPRAGYLYVFDRDLLSDGSMGEAMLIYPWSDMRGGENRVRPGKLVDIPAQEDDPSYFTARPSSPDQVGEVLTIIVTTSPLNLPISDKPFQISNVEMAKWEKMWGGQSERYEMEGGAGEAWTKQEQQAAARKGTRQLTRDDPAPQTIYRVSAANNKAFLVNVQLAYAR